MYFLKLVAVEIMPLLKNKDCFKRWTSLKPTKVAWEKFFNHLFSKTWKLFQAISFSESYFNYHWKLSLESGLSSLKTELWTLIKHFFKCFSFTWNLFKKVVFWALPSAEWNLEASFINVVISKNWNQIYKLSIINGTETEPFNWNLFYRRNNKMLLQT